MTALAALPALAILFVGQPAEPAYRPQVAEVQFGLPGTVTLYEYPERIPEEPVADGLLWAREIGGDHWLLVSAQPAGVSVQLAIPTGGGAR